MKRIITVIIIFAILILSSIYSILYTNAKCNEIIEYAEKTKSLIEICDMENAQKEQENLENIWNNHEKTMKLYLRRTNLDEIDHEMSGLSELIKLEDQTESGKALDLIIQYCYQIIEDEQPTIFNIL